MNFTRARVQNGIFGFMTCLCCLALAPAELARGQSPAAPPAAPLGASVDTASVSLDEFFFDKALRLELYQCGDARELTTTIHSLAE